MQLDRVVAERYERRSVCITSNLIFAQWDGAEIQANVTIHQTWRGMVRLPPILRGRSAEDRPVLRAAVDATVQWALPVGVPRVHQHKRG